MSNDAARVEAVSKGARGQGGKGARGQGVKGDKVSKVSLGPKGAKGTKRHLVSPQSINFRCLRLLGG